MQLHIYHFIIIYCVCNLQCEGTCLGNQLAVYNKDNTFMWSEKSSVQSQMRLNGQLLRKL